MLEFRTADGNPVKHHGSREITYSYEGQLYVVYYQVADVSGLIVSLGKLEGAGWSLEFKDGVRELRRGNEVISVYRRDGVFWIDKDFRILESGAQPERAQLLL